MYVAVFVCVLLISRRRLTRRRKVPTVLLSVIECDECALRWLTYDGFYRLTQSRCETSSSSADDDSDGNGSVERALVGPMKTWIFLWYVR